MTTRTIAAIMIAAALAGSAAAFQLDQTDSTVQATSPEGLLHLQLNAPGVQTERLAGVVYLTR